METLPKCRRARESAPGGRCDVPPGRFRAQAGQSEVVGHRTVALVHRTLQPARGGRDESDCVLAV